MPSLRAATCTPVDFVADDHFFGRDTGLINRSLQAIGVESVSIMPGTRHPDEPDDLIRATPDQLADVSWWRALKLDFVVLYAWGDPKYLNIAKAIRSAGIFLIQNLDSGSIDSPYANLQRWWVAFSDYIDGPLPLFAKARHMARGLRDLVPFIYERKRLKMLLEADVIGCVSPAARDCLTSYLSALGCPDLAGNLRVIPHPVDDLMRYSNEPKKKHALCVGRWHEADHHQKDPVLVIKILGKLLESEPAWEAEIIGREATALASTYRHLISPEISERLHFTNTLPRKALKIKYIKSQVILCASRYESFHISSAEALCCGCSVVAANHPLLASARWFASENSGTLAATRTLSDLLLALNSEVVEWEQSRRNPAEISDHWSPLLHGRAVAEKVTSIFTSQM